MLMITCAQCGYNFSKSVRSLPQRRTWVTTLILILMTMIMTLCFPHFHYPSCMTQCIIFSPPNWLLYVGEMQTIHLHIVDYDNDDDEVDDNARYV